MTTRELSLQDLDTGRRQYFDGYLLDLSFANTVFGAIADQRPGVVAEGSANCANWAATVDGQVLIDLIHETRASARQDGPVAADIDATHRYRLTFIEF